MDIKKYRILVICLTGFFLSASPAVVFAGAESGFYIGGGIGDSTVEANGTAPEGDYSFKESDTGYKLFGGYNFGIVPLIDVAVEVSYVDFGNPSGVFPVNNSINYDLTGYNAYGLIGLSFGPLGIFAKVGAIQWDSSSTAGSLSTSDSGSDPAYGLGVRFQLASFGLRAEYEVYDVGGSLKDLSMLSFSGYYTF